MASSVAALTITALLCALSTTVPSPSKLAIGAMVAFPIAAASAGFVQFYVLTESQDFVLLAIAMAPILIFGCLLSVRPQIAGIGFIMNIEFLVLLAPSNPQVYNPQIFFSECIFVAFALCLVFLATRLVWPVSDLDKQHAVPATNDLSLAAASAHLHLEQTSDDPAIRSRIGVLQRVLRSGSSRRLYAAARSILRHARGRQAESHEPLIAVAADLWAAGLVLEGERRLIRHFCDDNFAR